MHVGFLLSDRTDQAWHAAPIALELSRLFPGLHVSIYCAGTALLDTVKRIAVGFPEHRCELRRARASAWARMVHPLVNPWRPTRKRSVLRNNASVWQALDALVVPDLTSLTIKAFCQGGAPIMISTRHGAGDRAQGFDQRVAEFDFVLVPGPKIERRLHEAGLIRVGQYERVGYPKFDAVSRLPARPRIFDNDRPVVLYTPHFDPQLSSWPLMGREILEYFLNSTRYNLIFAPHIKLFARAGKYRAYLPRRYRRAANIYVDTGSRASADMTYTLAADVYLGDVSSQVYEFLWRPRPCVFLNPRGFDWQQDPNFAQWHCGITITQAEQLDTALEHAQRWHADYRAVQQAAFAETFDLSTNASAARAARAIYAFTVHQRLPKETCV